MKGFKSKKGISLIVLVITIIVMIILAAAIILSLNNSGIIDKANKAKKDSDTANLKEYVNVLQAEWELMPEAERAGKTSTQYVNEKLEDKYPDAALSADGEVYSGLNEKARAAIAAGIKIGDKVGYSVTSSSVKSMPTENGYENTSSDDKSQSISNKTDFTWKYIGISNKGELMISPDMVKEAGSTQDIPKMYIKGKVGFVEGPAELDRVCNVLYTTDKGIARSMDIDDVSTILEYTGPRGFYYNKGFDGERIDTPEAKIIADIAKEIGYDMENFKSGTPEEGKTIGEYKSSFYTIDDTSKYITKDQIRKELVYYPNHYFLADVAVNANFCDFDNKADFLIREVQCGETIPSIVNGFPMYCSENTEYDWNSALRPVVEIKPSVSLTYDSINKIWNLT